MSYLIKELYWLKGNITTKSWWECQVNSRFKKKEWLREGEQKLLRYIPRCFETSPICNICTLYIGLHASKVLTYKLIFFWMFSVDIVALHVPPLSVCLNKKMEKCMCTSFFLKLLYISFYLFSSSYFSWLLGWKISRLVFFLDFLFYKQ